MAVNFNKNKDVMITIGGLTAGGAEKNAIRMANEFATNGWNVTLLVFNLENEKYLHLVDKKVKLVNLKSRVRYGFLPFLYSIYSLRPKVVLSYNYEISVIAAIVKIIFRYKLVSRNINSFSGKYKNSTLGLWKSAIVPFIIKKFYIKSDYFISQSESMHKSFVEEFKGVASKSTFIPNPVYKYTDTSPVLNFNYILCVGRLVQQKNFELAIESYVSTGIYKNGIRLVIIGKGPEELYLKSYCKSLGVEKYVIFLEYSENIGRYFYNAKLTMLTSKYEGFPNVLLDSLSCGTPVVSVNCPTGPSEIIQNNINGLLVDEYDPNIIANAINHCLHKKFSSDDIAKSIEHFSMSQIFTKYSNLISSLQ